MSPRRPGILAALTAAICLLAAPAALAAGPDLTTSVSATPNPVAAGQYVSLEIVTDNVGTATAHNVVVKSFMPAKTQFIPATSGCALNAGTVECPVGDVPPGGNVVTEVVLRLLDFSYHGTFQNFVTAHTSDADADNSNDGSHVDVQVYNNSHDHHITVSKNEMSFSLQGGDTLKSFKLNCPNPNDIMTDGSVRVDNVDQDTGTLQSLSVLSQHAEGDGYRFILSNYASGQAQGHLFGTCISKTTQGANADSSGHYHTHDVQVGAPKTETISVVAGQHYNAKVSCDAGPGDYVAVVAPGYDVFGAEGSLNYSMPGYDANGRPAWDFGFNATQSGDVTFSIRCMNRWLTTAEGHSHLLWLSHPDKYFTVHPNAPAAGQYDIDCSDEAKGITAGFDLEDGLFMVGHDPQPKRRSFKILNFSGSDKTAHVVLLCVGDRTGTDPPPPAAPTAISHTANVGAKGASVPVKLACPAGGCGGTIELLASGAGTRAVSASAKVIGRGVFKTNSRGIVVTRISVAKKYRSAIASGKISKVTAVVRKQSGKVAKRQTIRLKRS
ncbi:MAG: conserved repeat domain [Solirubrobacterales bacterium]|nr:conserved repeat domain [Solirubrobacterales bacterium]